MSVSVSCPTCHRQEVWTDGVRAVILPGGARRPAEHRELAAYRVVARSRAGDLGPIVGPCPACGGPLTASAGAALPVVPWRFRLPTGEAQVDAMGTHGAADFDDLGAQLEAAYAARWQVAPGRLAFQLFVIPLALVPVLVWMWSVVFTTWFLSNFFRG